LIPAPKEPIAPKEDWAATEGQDWVVETAAGEALVGGATVGWAETAGEALEVGEMAVWAVDWAEMEEAVALAAPAGCCKMHL